jgi:hypothetical protein
MRKFIIMILILTLFPLIAVGQQNQGADIWTAAAYGNTPGVTYLKLTGWNEAVTTSYEVVWAQSAAYTPLTVAMSAPYCASSDANDTSAGTGARTIQIKGVNTSFARFSENLTMNGQTSVVIATTNVLFIDSIEVLTAGSGLLNAGVIRCGTGTNTSGVPATPHQTLAASSATVVPGAGVGGGNISHSFMYGVPANHRLICRNFAYGTYLVTTVNGLQAVIDGYTNSTGVLKRYFHGGSNNTGATTVVNPMMLVFPEKTLVLGKIAATAAEPGFLSAECLLIKSAAVDVNQRYF